MLKIQKNSRQMPKKQEIVSQKYYSDILYSYLQVNSQKEGDIRYVNKNLTKQVSLASALGVSRQTIAKRLNKLIELGLIIPPTESQKYYTLPTLAPSEGFLISEATLRIMGNTLNENTINVYIYLTNKYYANNCQPIDFTLQALKSFCGLGTKGDTNNYIITDILFVLQKLGLIEWSVSTHRENNNGPIKTYYHLNKANTTCC